ncbi:hypothetical protein SAMN05216311_101333 [Chitinophaga sp. CF418]|nr:hypothetical protein SAMN05216311_101333 [Chitinophaga sp. CF418]
MKWIYLFLLYVGITFIITECYNMFRLYNVPADCLLSKGGDVFDTGAAFNEALLLREIKNVPSVDETFSCCMQKIFL